MTSRQIRRGFVEEQLIKVLFIFVTFIFPNIGYSAVPNMATNLRLDSLNSTNRIAQVDTVPSRHIGVPEPAVLNTHQIPGTSGSEWQTNPEPWEPGNGANGSAYDAVAPLQPSGWPETEVTNYYYIDPGHASCSDAKTYGFPDTPRCTMPDRKKSVAPGSRIELASSNGTAGYYNSRYSPNLGLIGTRDEPIWIVGNKKNPPFVSATWRLTDATWLYVEGITWGDQTTSTDNRPLCLSLSGTRIDHVVVRQNTCRNRHHRNRNISGYLYPDGFGIGVQLVENALVQYVHFHNNKFLRVGEPAYDLSLVGDRFHVANDTKHGFIGGEAVYIVANEDGGRVPAPLIGDRKRVYSVINVTPTTFQLAVEGELTAIPLVDGGRGSYPGFHVYEVAPSSVGLDVDTDYHSLTITAFNVDRTTNPRAHHIWFTDNSCILGVGDCIQITGQNLGGTTADDARDVIHHVWVNGNRCEKMRQSCVFSKTQSHFIVSENICIQNDDGGGCFNLQYAPTYTWYMFNTAYNSSGFSRNSTNNISPSVSSSVKMINYWLNNISINSRVSGRFNFNGMPMSGGFIMAQNPPLEAGSRRYIGWNTCIDCYTFYTNPGAGDTAEVAYYIYKNAHISPPTVGQTEFANVQKSHYVYELNSNQKSSTHFDCNLIDSRHPFLAGRVVSNSLLQWQENSTTNEDANSFYSDPMLMNENHDLTLLDATPSENSNLVDPPAEACAGTNFQDGHNPYLEFKNLYGIDIFVDYYGNPREAGGISDIGAVERQ
mgnify:FL=1